MNERLNVYDINNYAYLEKDIEITIDKIGNLYEIHFLKNKIVFVSKIKFPENASWISNETTNTFNESIPIIKSIIKDIYSILEGVFVFKYKKFDKLKQEKKYIYLKELREFNNKLKHHNNKNVTFQLVSIININQQTLDCMIQYKYEEDVQISIISLAEFFKLFFNILEAEEIIQIDRE